MPFQVVANFQSKRKTPPQLAFYNGDRLFGADAEALLGRKPQLVVGSPHTLLGRNITHPLVEAYLTPGNQASKIQLRTSGNDTEQYVRPGLELVLPNDIHYSAEELTSMLLGHARDFASHVAEQKIQDAVITIPAYATQSERLALISAAELAGIKVLALIDENTATGVHYGIDRIFENTTHYMMLYNMGAETTQVCFFFIFMIIYLFIF